MRARHSARIPSLLGVILVTGCVREPDPASCTMVPDSCPADRRCAAVEGHLRCVCADGYLTSGDVCLDIDECAEGSDGCPADTTCRNLPGSFSCYCAPGLEGQCCVDLDGDERGPG